MSFSELWVHDSKYFRSVSTPTDREAEENFSVVSVRCAIIFSPDYALLIPRVKFDKRGFDFSNVQPQPKIVAARNGYA